MSSTIYLTEEKNGMVIPMTKATCQKKLFAKWVEDLNSCVSIKNLPSIGVQFLKYKMREREIVKDNLPPLEGNFSKSMGNLSHKYSELGIPEQLMNSKKIGKAIKDVVPVKDKKTVEKITNSVQNAATVLTPRSQQADDFSFQQTPLQGGVSSQGGLRVKPKKTTKKTPKKTTKKTPKKTTKKTPKKTTKK